MYAKVKGVAPAGFVMQRYFQVTAPSVHAMVVGLDAAGLILRPSRVARSIRVLVAPDLFPTLR